MTRDEKVAAARRMRVEGRLLREISDALGVPRSTVSTWIDPDHATKQKQRRKRYEGVCVECGAPTCGAFGRGLAPKLCIRCTRQKHHEERRWTRDTILAAFSRYFREYRDQPAASEILAMRPGDWFPTVGTVQREFGSWSAAIKAAGWRPNAKRTGGEGMHGYIVLRQNGDGGFHPVATIEAESREGAIRKHLAEAPEGKREGVYVTVPQKSWAPRHVRVQMQPVLIFDPSPTEGTES